MLIDDRQIRSVHVNKIIDLAKVGISNQYKDLDGIPTEFQPIKHEHPLATLANNGYMSKEDFKKVKELKEFKYLRIKNLKSTDLGDKIIEAATYDDTITIEAGDNVVFKWDEAIRKLTISIDYNLDDGLKGPKGDTGPKGDAGITWRPKVNSDGKVSYTNDSNSEPPDPVYVRGADGPQGARGADAPTPEWNNLPNKPTGNRGDIYYLQDDGVRVITKPAMALGMFPMNQRELDVYLARHYDFDNVRYRWYQFSTTLAGQEVDQELLNNAWQITQDGISYDKNLIGYAMLADNRFYENFTFEVEFYDFEFTGVLGVIFSGIPDDYMYFKCLSLVRTASKDNYNFNRGDSTFYNFMIAEAFNHEFENKLRLMSLPEAKIPSGRVKTKYKVIRTPEKVVIYYHDILPLNSTYPAYSESKKIEYKYLNSDDVYGRNYRNLVSYGFATFNMKIGKVIYTCDADVNNKIYPIFNALPTMYYDMASKSWVETDMVTSEDAGIGRFIKDVNTGKTYYIVSDNYYLPIRETSTGGGQYN